MHCRRCSFAGHNAGKCPNGGVEKYMPPRKKKTSNTMTDGEGPSQATQD